MITRIQHFSVQLVILWSCGAVTSGNLSDGALLALRLNARPADHDSSCDDKTAGIAARVVTADEPALPEQKQLTWSDIKRVDHPEAANYVPNDAAVPGEWWPHHNAWSESTLLSDQFVKQSIDGPLEWSGLDDLSLQQDRQAIHFGVIYGLIWLLVLVWGASMSVAMSRRSHLENELILERRLNTLKHDPASLHDEENLMLAEIARQLAEHAEDMFALRSSNANDSPKAVLAEAEESAKS